MTVTDPDVRYHPVVAALYDPVQAYFERYQGPEHREYLAAELQGEVLEIAVGTGATIPYYEGHVDETTRLHGVEPDPGMWKRARERAADHGVGMELVSGRAETLPYEDDTFEYVIESGLFCSVPSVGVSLEEIERVLAPDGEFRFFDHVRSDGLVGRSQDLLSPLWERAFANCHLNRRITPQLEAFDRLELVEVERQTVGYWPVREFVRGRAKPAGR